MECFDWIDICAMFTIIRESQEHTPSRPTPLSPSSTPPPASPAPAPAPPAPPAPPASPASPASPAPSPSQPPPTTTVHPNPDLDAKRTLQALMDDASPHSSHHSTTIPIPSDATNNLATSTTTEPSTSFSSFSNIIAPDVPVAVLTIDDQDITLLVDHSLNKHRNRLLSCKANQASKKGFRTIRFTSPSRRRRRRRLVHGATVEQSVQSMDMEALRALLIQHGLVQRGTTAPLDVLRDIARGVFQTD